MDIINNATGDLLFSMVVYAGTGMALLCASLLSLLSLFEWQENHRDYEN